MPLVVLFAVLSGCDSSSADDVPEPPTTAAESTDETALAGTVTEGPAGCALLVTDLDLRYVLRGDLVSDLRVGNEVRIQGERQDGYDDRCAGIVFAVTKILSRSPL